MHSPMSHVDTNRNFTLDELSKEKAYILTPSIVYLGVLMVVGMIGNAIVLFVYYFRFNASTHRCFILVLAFYDFFACTVGAPWAIAESFFAFTYMEPVSCKIFRFILYYTCIASSLTLVLIAFERFRKICKPLKPQMTVPTAKRALFLVAGVISSVSACPALILYGNDTIGTGVRDMNGTECFISEHFENSLWPTAFNVYLLILAFASTVCMTVCYVGIARKVAQMGKDKIMRRAAVPEKSVVENSVDNDYDSDVPSSEMVDSVSNDNRKSTATSYSLSSFHGKVRGKTSKFARKVFKRLSSKSGKKTLRITKMLTFVTIAFVVSYLPHLSLMLWDMFTSTEKKDSLPKDNIYQILFYSFFLNNLVNPFIYASMDLKFRKEVKNLVKCKDA